MVTDWLMVSRRTIAIASAASVSIAGLGVMAALLSGDAVWIIASLLVVVMLVTIVLAKAAENSRRQLLLRIVERVESTRPGSDDLRYEPGTALDLLRRDLQHDLNAMAFTWSRLKPDHPMPSPGGWAATPETLASLVSAASDLKEEPTIVECGSGTSTVWLALTLERRGVGHIVSLEHDEAWVEVTRARLDATGLAHRVEVRYAPLASDGGAVWYERSAVEDLHDIAMLFVDGPPGAVAREARHPAFPILRDRLCDGALVVLDDIDRDDEQRTLARWIEESNGGLRAVPSLHDSRAAFLRWERPPAPTD